MASRMAARHHKKATMLVTKETLMQALQEARDLVNKVGRDDPRAAELIQLYNDIAAVTNNREEDLSAYFDDAISPDTARELKSAVDRIAQLKNEISRPAPPPATTPAPVRASANTGHLECPYCERGGFKNQQELDNHVDDEHQGRLASKNASPKGAPMSSRLFARKKKVQAEDEMLDAAPEAVAGDAPAEPLPDEGAAPAPAAPAAPPVAPPTAGNPYANLPTEALTAIVESLTGIDQFETNPAILGAIEQVAEELKNRPMQPAAPEGAPKAAAKKVAVTPPGISEDLMHKLKKEYPGEPEKAYGTAWKIHNEKEGASDAPAGWEPATAVMQSSGLPAPQANVLANWMKAQGYTPHKAAFLIRRRGVSPFLSKFAAVSQGVPPVNEDTMNKVDGQPHEVPEVGEAHADREGVEKAEKHDDKPGASVTTITSPQDLGKQAAANSEISKALKLAEQLESKLGELYLDAKPIIRANASAAVRDAVESIYDSKNKFAEAKKVLNKHEMQATAEEEAQKAALSKDKKASRVGGLALAAAEN